MTVGDRVRKLWNPEPDSVTGQTIEGWQVEHSAHGGIEILEQRRVGDCRLTVWRCKGQGCLALNIVHADSYYKQASEPAPAEAPE